MHSYRLKSRSDFAATPLRHSQIEACKQEQTLPFKPFYMKFLRVRAQMTDHRSNKEVSLDFSAKGDELLSKRVFTEAQTNDFYASDFEQQSESLDFRETVREQNQNRRQSSLGHRQSSCSGIPQSIDSHQSPEQTELYTVAFLRKRNRQLITYIEYFRSVMPLYKVNVLTLKQQRRQLEKLKKMKNKAFDYSYELTIDKLQKRNLYASKVNTNEIKQCSAVFEKQKYQCVREAFVKGNSTSCDLQKSAIHLDNKPRRLSIKQGDLLSKLRQYYKHQDTLKLQQQKIEQYNRMLDLFENILSKGNELKLEQRKRNLLNEISSKKTIISINQIELNLNITNTNNQLAAIETRLIDISKQQNLLKEQIIQIKSHHNYSTLHKSRQKIQNRNQTLSGRIISQKSKKKTAVLEKIKTQQRQRDEEEGRLEGRAIERFMRRYRAQGKEQG